MKMSARSYVWWPMYEIAYLFNKHSLEKKKLFRQAGYPFERIHFFKFAGKYVLILSDAHTKYCEVKLMHVF